MNRILIIDDQEDVRAELRERIASMNHESDEASSQEEAIRKLGELAYDCVLLDLAIPLKSEGITRIEHGRNLLLRIVAMNSAPPVIVITSNGLNGHKLAVEMIHLGAVSFVGKPFDDDPIEPKIQMVLDRKGAGGAAVQNSGSAFSGGVLVLNDDGIELAEAFPHAVFRSGNATGSDEAFGEGVATVPGGLGPVPAHGHLGADEPHLQTLRQRGMALGVHGLGCLHGPGPGLQPVGLTEALATTHVRIARLVQAHDHMRVVCMWSCARPSSRWIWIPSLTKALW